MSARCLGLDVTSATCAGDFIQLAKLLGATKGDVMLAARLAEQRQMPTLASVLRAAMSAGSLSNPNFASSIAQYPDLVSEFLDSLRNASAFDRMLPDMKRTPLRARAVVVTAGATAYTVGEGQMKPISSLSLSGSLIDPVKVMCAVVMSDELWRSADAAAEALFARELRAAIASQTDTQFVSQIIANTSPVSSSGSTTVAVRTDLINALCSMDTDAASRLYILVSPRTAKSLCFMDSDGPPSFADVTPQGGMIRACQCWSLMV
jgi:HK97 family phage major capsid protein